MSSWEISLWTISFLVCYLYSGQELKNEHSSMGSLIFTMRESKENGHIFIWHKRTDRMIRDTRYSGHGYVRKLRDSPVLIVRENKRRLTIGNNCGTNWSFAERLCLLYYRMRFCLTMEKNAVGTNTTFRSFANAIAGKRGSRCIKKDERINLSNTSLFLCQCHGESFTPDRPTTKAHQREKEIRAKLDSHRKWLYVRAENAQAVTYAKLGTREKAIA